MDVKARGKLQKLEFGALQKHANHVDLDQYNCRLAAGSFFLQARQKSAADLLVEVALPRAGELPGQLLDGLTKIGYCEE